MYCPTFLGGGISAAKAMFELISGIQIGSPRSPLQPLQPGAKSAMEKDLLEEGYIVQHLGSE